MPPPAWTSVENNTHVLWYKDAGLRWNVFHGLGLCLVIATNGYGVGLLTGFQAMPQWTGYFDNPKGNLLGLYAAAYFLPSIVTSYIGDYISTAYGRRWAIFVGMSLMLAGSVVNTFANGVGMWVGGRAIIGAGVGVVKVAAPVLIQEIAHPRLRATLGSCYQAFAYIGTVVSAFMCFAGLYVKGDWGWRFPSLLQIIGPAMVLAVAWHCPESPRWLVKHGKAEQARAVMAKYHANGDLDDPLVELQMREIGVALANEEANKQNSYVDFVRTPGNRRRLFVMAILALSLNWMGNNIISYYLAPILRSVGITKPVQITLINAGLAVWNLILALTAAVKADRFGRRPMFLTSVAGMFICYAVIMGLSAGFANTKQTAVGSAVIPFLFIYFGFYSMAFTPLPIAYTVEIMPFSLRGKGMALFTSIATCGNSLAQFLNPVILDAIAWKYYGVFLAILVFYGVVIFFVFPETKRMSAEEASAVFDQPHRFRSQAPDVEAPGPSAAKDSDEITQQMSEGSLEKHSEVAVEKARV